MTNKVKKIRNTPFDDVFRTLLEKCNKLIIPVINEVFHTDYSFKDEVLVLANEQYFSDEDGHDIKKVTDSYLKIRDNTYHIECQSTDDSYMEIRMMEYDIHIAFDNIIFKNGIRIVELPQSAVLVVKDDSKFPDFLKAYIRIPQYNSHSTTYKDVEYQVPTIKIINYTKDDIINKNLLFLAPYYIIKFRRQLDEINNDAARLNELTSEYQDMYEQIARLSEDDILDESYLYDIVSLTERLIDVVAYGKENIRREVNVMGGNVLKLDREILIEENQEIGKEIGEERLGNLFSIMLRNNASQSDLEKVSTDKEYRKEMYRKYNIQ